MKELQKHRIYKHMSEPLRFLGLTVDELVLGSGGFLFSLYFTGSYFKQAIFLIVGVGGTLFLRQLKKQKSIGTDARSFLTNCGILPAPSIIWPPFDQKEFF